MFNVGDKVRVVSPESFYYRHIGTMVDVGGSISSVDFGRHVNLFLNVNLERVDDMGISERLSEVIKENQNLKQQLSEQNIKLNKIQGGVRREQGVSDEEFGEAYEFYSGSNKNVHATVWGNLYLENIFSNLSLSEFVNKYKEYKDKQNNEIRVRDEVNDGNTTAIVTSTYERSIYVLYRDGSCGIHPKDKYTKTGKHYDSIDEFMNS